MKKSRFGYEELQVRQKAVEFALLAIDRLDQLDAPRKHYRLIEQLEAACTACGCMRSHAVRVGKAKPFVLNLSPFTFEL